jgi:ketosteroid isomerase-like protein
MIKLATVLCGLALATPAMAQAPAQPAAPPHGAAAPAPPAAAPAAPDMTKMGPMTRKVAKEDKKGIADFYKAWEEGFKKSDINALVALVDFPVIMMSDNSKGEEGHFEANREQWTKMFSAFLATPKDVKFSSKQAPTFLSETLAVVIESMNMTAGKTKGSWKGFSVLTLKDGKWKLKQMAEAGWGDMAPAGAPAPKKAPSAP